MDEWVHRVSARVVGPQPWRQCYPAPSTWFGLCPHHLDAAYNVHCIYAFVLNLVLLVCVRLSHLGARVVGPPVAKDAVSPLLITGLSHHLAA